MKKTLFCSFLIIYSFCSFSQVKTKFLQTKKISEQVKFHIKNEAPKIKMQKIEAQKYLEEDKKEYGLNIPMRFGIAIDVNLDIISDGEWFNIDSGRIWKLELSSDGAFSINMIFDKFFIPNGAELFIYSSDNSMAFGPITNSQNNVENRFSTDLLKGNSVTLELYEPNAVKNQTILRISKIIHGYKNMFSDYVSTDPTYDSENCNNDVDCPEFNNWQDQTNAVSLVLLADGTRLCSGCLLNNTNNDFRPFFLTAFHCIDVGNPNISNLPVQNGWTWIYPDPDENDGVLENYEITEAQNWVFRYQYKSPTPVCDGTETMADDTYFLSFSGSTLRASWSNTDFALVEMNTTPPRGNQLFYAGYSRSNAGATTSAGIHHPGGDVMKISVDNNTAAEAVDWQGGVADHWRVTFDDGTMQLGSSGSPLFDQNRRVVGQCHGMQNYNPSLTYCEQRTIDYGRFDLSWTGDGANNNRLSNWLDPINIIGTNGTFNGAYQDCPVTDLSSLTWSSNTNYSNCQISISNSSINNNASVTFSSESKVTINGSFNVQYGSTFIIE